jgi:hypothetical protein
MKKLAFAPSLSADQTVRFLNYDGRSVSVRLKWSGRSGFWFMDVTYQPEVDQPPTTLYGIKLVPGFPLLRQYSATFPFPGGFLLLPTALAMQGVEILYDDLGANWFLYLLSPAEISSWEASNGLG